MIDVYLQQMLQAKESSFELAYEQCLDEYVDSLNLEIDPDSLSSLSAKRASIKQQLRGDASSLELDLYISSAVKFLIKDGAQYLEADRFQEMINRFKAMNERLEKIDFKNEIPDDMQAFFEIEDTILAGIYQIGIAKFKENEYLTALSCFVLLASLNPDSSDYWYREGIAAQKCEKYPLALNAYAHALDLNPELIGAKVFSAECFLSLGEVEKGKEALDEAKELVKSLNDDSWNAVIARIEND